MGQNCCSSNTNDAEIHDPPVVRPSIPAEQPRAKQSDTEERAKEVPVAPQPGEIVVEESPAEAATVEAAESVPSEPGGDHVDAPAAAVADSPASALSFDLVLADLDAAENLAYAPAFASFSPSTGGGVGVDSALLRDFVATNSCVPYAALDETLLAAASVNEDMLVKLADFLKLMRDYAMQETLILEKFVELAGDGEHLNAADCRTGLFMMKDEFGPVAASVGEARWDAVFDKVMGNAGATVDMESWGSYCRQVARIARVTHAAKL